jgi:hypothetical protein
MPIIGWIIEPTDLLRMRTLLPPKYVPVYSPHCTLSLGGHQYLELPGPEICKVYGKVDDDMGVEALLVSINGSKVRPDGRIFHITWSLAEGRKPRESNDVICWNLPAALEERIEASLIPAFI